MITIDVDSREMFIPEDEKVLGVTHDHESMIKVFRIPRFTIRGLDLSDFTFKVLFMRNDNTDGFNAVDRVDVGDVYIHVYWKVGSEAVTVPGKISVQLEATRVNDESIILQAWHSQYGEFKVYPAHENGYIDEDGHEYRDILAYIQKNTLEYVNQNITVGELDITEAELNDLMSAIFYRIEGGNEGDPSTPEEPGNDPESPIPLNWYTNISGVPYKNVSGDPYIN